MDKNAKRYFIYARKSTGSEDRQVRSIKDQLAEINVLLQKERCNVIDKFEESQSAMTKGRPTFNEMLDRVEKGEADGIIAWHPDRLARNAFDGGRIIDLLDEGKLRDLKFCTYWFENTAQGKFFLAMAFSQGKYYSDTLSVSVHRGLHQKAKEGLWPGFAPIGYLNDHKTATIFPDPERGHLVAKTFELYATGEFTLDRLTESINALGMTSRNGNPLARAQYHRLLRNPIYFGIIRYCGQLYEAVHKPLISKHLFDRVQEITSGKRKPRTKRMLKPYLYRRVFHCGECGGVITIETQKGMNYLRCTKKKGPCSQPFLREDETTEQIAAALKFIAVPDDWIDSMLCTLEKEQRAESVTLDKDRNELKANLALADEKLDRLTTAYVENVLPLEEFTASRAKLLSEKALLKEQKAELEKNPSFWLEPTERFVKTLQEATLTASSHDEAEKLKLFKKTGSNLKILHKKIEFEFRGAWKTVEKHGRLAQSPAAPPIRGAACVGKSAHVFTLAESERRSSIFLHRQPNLGLALKRVEMSGIEPSDCSVL
jgi:DNA invertase Pin-like site-specific DNA recombinase